LFSNRSICTALSKNVPRRLVSPPCYGYTVYYHCDQPVGTTTLYRHTTLLCFATTQTTSMQIVYDVHIHIVAGRGMASSPPSCKESAMMTAVRAYSALGDWYSGLSALNHHPHKYTHHNNPCTRHIHWGTKRRGGRSADDLSTSGRSGIRSSSIYISRINGSGSSCCNI
jgi:hypothetical protein